MKNGLLSIGRPTGCVGPNNKWLLLYKSLTNNFSARFLAQAADVQLDRFRGRPRENNEGAES
jgi:hypothetical protein